MAKQNIMILDINDIYIKIVVGDGKKITIADKIRTPEGAVRNRSILDVDAVVDVIARYRNQNSIQEKNLVFIIKGQDTIVKHEEVPIMEYDKILDSAKWEISQYIPEQGEGHYINFQILDKIVTNENKVYKLLVAAAPKEKVDKYNEISNKLGMKLVAVDLAANCIARVFSNIYEKNKKEENIGIVDLGQKESSLIILEKGKLSIERDLPFGISNISNLLNSKMGMAEDEVNNFLSHKISLANINEEDEIEFKIKRQFDNVFSSFEKVIQFFYAGKGKNKLDKIYLIGDGTSINGIEQYIYNFLDTEVSVINNISIIPLTVNKNLDLRTYISSVGAVIRKNNNTELNLCPDKINGKSKVYGKYKKYIIPSVALFAIMIISIAGLKLYELKLNNDNDTLIQKINSNAAIEVQYEKLSTQKSDYTKQIKTADTINKNKVYILKWMKGITDNAPSNVQIVSITKNKGDTTITITAQTTDINAIPLFSKNLQDSGKYTDVKIGSVSSDKDSNYKFTITEKEAVK